MPWPIRTLPLYPEPAPIRWHRWALFFMGLLLVNMVLVLRHASHMPSTQTLDFWLLMLGTPMVAFAIVFGLRLNIQDREHERKETWNRCADRLEQEWATWGQRYRIVTKAWTALPVANDIQMWFDAPTSLPVQIGRALSLNWTPIPTAKSWISSWFNKVADTLAPDLQALRGTLDVHVLLDTETFQALQSTDTDVSRLWMSAWAKHTVAFVPTVTVHPNAGLSELDGWMDDTSKTPLLLLAAQRAADPHAPAFSEAAVALLFQSAGKSAANPSGSVRVYRPMSTGLETLSEDVDHLYRTQGGNAKAIGDVWHTSLDSAMQGHLKAAMAYSAHNAGQNVRLWCEHKMDDGLGLPGPLSGWIALGLAVQAASCRPGPQLAVSSDDPSMILCMVTSQGRS